MNGILRRDLHVTCVVEGDEERVRASGITTGVVFNSDKLENPEGQSLDYTVF